MRKMIQKTSSMPHWESTNFWRFCFRPEKCIRVSGTSRSIRAWRIFRKILTGISRWSSSPGSWDWVRHIFPVFSNRKQAILLVNTSPMPGWIKPSCCSSRHIKASRRSPLKWDTPIMPALPIFLQTKSGVHPRRFASWCDRATVSIRPSKEERCT